MKILITGGCGFVGSNLAIFLKKNKYKVYSLDNLYRKGSKYNLSRLKNFGIKNYNFDIKNFSKLKKLQKFDLIIDACAEPSVNSFLSDIDRLIETNLIGTFNIIKKCLKDNTKIIFLSSSRVYDLNSLNSLIKKKKIKNKINLKKEININFSTNGVKSLYGFTKFTSEELIKEISFISKLRYIITRFGVIAGPYQFGKVDQGFFSLWMWRHINKKKLSYKGYGGYGNQIRDILHINDLCELIHSQIKKLKLINNETFVAGGGLKNAVSLKQLTSICQKITGNKIKILREKKTSIYDIPYFVTSNNEVKKIYKWSPKKNIEDIANDIYSWQLKNYKILKNYFN